VAFISIAGRRECPTLILLTMATAVALLVTLFTGALSGTPDSVSPKPSSQAGNVAPCDPDEIPTTQKAFASAEGFGRFARGGRGGVVYQVTTLADVGPGSLRECAEGTGPRTCVFRVSGTIVVDDWIKVLKPYLTIAGQTSPGGIAIRNGKSPNAPMLIQTHDVIVRHLRLRPGPSPGSSNNVDTIQISGGAHDVILDHVSTSWPTDEGINIVGLGHQSGACGETRNITVQWSILSEGLSNSSRGPHSRGSYFGYGAREISFHHNLIADNMRRNPLLNTRGQFDMINNVIYNSGTYNGEFYTRFGALSVNLIGNIAIIGPSSDKSTQLYLANYFRDFPAPFAIYLKDNVDLHRPTNRGDERLVLEPSDWQFVKSSPIGTLSVSPASITGPGQAYRDILVGVGANRPVRDAVDTRVLQDMAACRGAIIDDPAQVGGWPNLEMPLPPTDSDADGMPDAWERAHGLSPRSPDDRNGNAGGGYTNLEKYMDELAVPDGSAPDVSINDPDPFCGFAIAKAPPLPSIAIKASPAKIAIGDSAQLTWEGTSIKNCKVANRYAEGRGSLLVWPVKTITYQIECTGKDGGDAIDSVIIEVSGPLG
jgi:pectate lyase